MIAAREPSEAAALSLLVVAQDKQHKTESFHTPEVLALSSKRELRSERRVNDHAGNRLRQSRQMPTRSAADRSTCASVQIGGDAMAVNVDEKKMAIANIRVRMSTCVTYERSRPRH